MDLTITDPAAVARLRDGTGPVFLRDPEGKILGVVGNLDGYGAPPPGWKSPFTDEERAEMRKQQTGRPVKDILRDLEERG